LIVPLFADLLNEVQQALFVDRYSRLSGLTRFSTLDGRQPKAFTDTVTILRLSPSFVRTS
jgi:hypothetical protein